MTQKEKLVGLLNECKLQTIDAQAEFLLDMGVIIPPCKIGETLFDIAEFIERIPHPELYANKIRGIGIESGKDGELIYSINYDIDTKAADFGVSLFTDITEALDALKAIDERSGNDDND